MLIIKKIFLFLFLFLLFNICKINSLLIQFNNTIINKCTNITTPCDLSLGLYWENQEIPKTGDDVIIDFSNITSKNNIYLSVQNISLELMSFNLIGQEENTTVTNLIIQNSNLTILNEFNLQYSNVTIYNDKNFINNQININSFNSDSSILLFNGYLNISFNTSTINYDENNSDYYPLIFNQSVAFTIYESIELNAEVQSSHGCVIKFLGNTTIEKAFTLNGITEFLGNSTIIMGSGDFNIVHVLGNLIILDTIMVTISEYQLFVSQIPSTISLINSELQLYNKIGGYRNFNGDVNLYNGSTLYIPSGYSIEVRNTTVMNGSIVIMDSEYDTGFSNLVCTELSVISNGNITLLNSTLGYVTLNERNSTLTIESSSFITELYNRGTTDIQAFSSLTIASSSTSNITLVDGTLGIYGVFVSNEFYVSKYGSVYGEFQINGPIISSGSIDISSLNSQIDSAIIESKGKLTIVSYLEIQEDLVMDNLSILQIGFVSINNMSPIILVSSHGQVNLTNIFLKIYLEIVPSSNDKIYLIQNSHGSNNINISNDQIIFLTSEGSQLDSNILYSIEQDSFGNVNIVFKNLNSGLSNWKIAIIIVVSGLSIIIVISLVCYIRKRNQYLHHHDHHHDHHHHDHHDHHHDYHHHHHHSENDPLIH